MLIKFNYGFFISVMQEEFVRLRLLQQTMVVFVLKETILHKKLVSSQNSAKCGESSEKTQLSLGLKQLKETPLLFLQ